MDASYTDLMDQLRSRGLRMTPQRRAIVSEVMRAKGHISPTAIARKVQGDMPGVNASTVYRTLTLLESVGVLMLRPAFQHAGLLTLVGRRRRFLYYLQRNDLEGYRALIKELGLRR